MHFVLDDERRHRDRLAAIHVAHLRPPQLGARRGVDGDGVTVEQVVDDLAVGERRAAIHDVAARDADRRLRILRPVLPLERKARLRQIERVRHVRVWRDDVHRVADDERLALVAAQHAGRECPRDVEILRVARRDLRERTVSASGVVAAGQQPLAVLVVRRRRGDARAGDRGASLIAAPPVQPRDTASSDGTYGGAHDSGLAKRDCNAAVLARRIAKTVPRTRVSRQLPVVPTRVRCRTRCSTIHLTLPCSPAAMRS